MAKRATQVKKGRITIPVLNKVVLQIYYLPKWKCISRCVETGLKTKFLGAIYGFISRNAGTIPL